MTRIPATRRLLLRHRRAAAAATLLIVLSGSLAAARAQTSVIHMKSGQDVDAKVLSVDKTAVKWQLASSSGSVQTTPYPDISYIDFPSVDGWDDAETALAERRFEDAVKLYEDIGKAQFSGNYFPAPGNFSTLARRRLFDCYRALVEPEKLAGVRKNIVLELLPPDLADPGLIVEAWAAAGEKEWEKIIEIAEKMGALESVSAEAAEIGYLKGLAFAELGEIDLALTEFGKAYTLNLGTDSPIASAALRKSAELIDSIGIQDRNPEIRALVHVYAEIYGKKSLWDGAGSSFASLRKEKLPGQADLGDAVTPAASKPASAPASTPPAPPVAIADTGTDPEMTAVTPVTPVAPVGDDGLGPAAANPGADGILFKIDFNPANFKGDASNRKFNLYTADGGAFRFRVKSNNDTYTVTSAQIGTSQVYVENGKYRFSVTSLITSPKAKRAQCAISLGYMNEGKFNTIKKWEGYGGKNGQGGYKNKYKIKVEGATPAGHPAIGKPIAIRLTGRGGKEIQFFSDGKIEKLAE